MAAQGDAQRVSQFLQRDYVRRFRGWREAEWKLICGAEPLSFSDRIIDGGVRLDFKSQRSDAGGLVDDGSLEVCVRGNSVAWTSRGGGFPSRIALRVRLPRVRAWTRVAALAAAGVGSTPWRIWFIFFLSVPGVGSTPWLI